MNESPDHRRLRRNPFPVRGTTSMEESILERDLHRAARLLSPLKKGGLGTHDDLKMIDAVDEVYLRVRELLFLWNLELDERRT
jgi:hypothetical protein